MKVKPIESDPFDLKSFLYNGGRSLMWRLVVIFSMLLISCSTSSVGYIKILGNSGDVINRMEAARSILIEDKRFEASSFSTLPEPWIQEAAFVYDPTPEDKISKAKIKYSVLIQANTYTGELVVFFHEFSTSEMSKKGVKIFGELAAKTKLVFGEKYILSGLDKDKYFELSRNLKKPM